MKQLSSLLAVAIVLAAFAGPAAAKYPPPSGETTPGGNPDPDPSYGSSTYDCSNELGHLRRVYEHQLDLIVDQDRVAIVPICDNGDYGLMRSDGNAGALRHHIAENTAISGALDFANYLPDDVVGVRMTGDESVIIYVHTFLYR